MSISTINHLDGFYDDFKVFENISLEIESRSFTAIIGPNGAGKSTLLKYLIKELKAPANSVFVQNKDVCKYSQYELAKEVSFVSQSNKTIYDFTVKELVSMGRYCHGDEISNSPMIEKALEATGIENLANRKITEISGGELQLAMLSRALCQDTELILLDEPINNLDPYHQILLMKTLKQMSLNGKTVVCVLHDLNSVLEYCTHCIILKGKSIFASGKTQDVLTENNIEQVFNIKCRISPSDGRIPSTVYCSL